MTYRVCRRKGKQTGASHEDMLRRDTKYTVMKGAQTVFLPKKLTCSAGSKEIRPGETGRVDQ